MDTHRESTLDRIIGYVCAVGLVFALGLALWPQFEPRTAPHTAKPKAVGSCLTPSGTARTYLTVYDLNGTLVVRCRTLPPLAP